MRKRISINGIDYRSFDEIPPDVRANFQRMLSKFADKDLNGIPDIFEDDQIGDFVFSDDSKIVINDNEYTGFEHLPAFIRKAFEEVIEIPNQSSDAISERQTPNFLTRASDDHPSWQTDMRPLVRSSKSKDVHKPVSTASRFITVLIALSIIAIGILLLFIFFLR